MKTLATVTTLALSLAMTGCVSPKSEAPVVKAMPAMHIMSVKPLEFDLKAIGQKLFREKVKKQALSGVGVRYVFSGMSRYGWDCSGFTAYVFDKFGIKLEHSATKQAFQGKQVASPEVGDIVAFSYGSPLYFYHVGIYVGNGNVVDANSYYGRTIVEPLSNFKGNLLKFIRMG